MLHFLPCRLAETCLLIAVLTCSCQHCPCCSKDHAPVATMPNAARSTTASTTTPVIHTVAKHSLDASAQNQASASALNQANPTAQAPTDTRFSHDPKYRWMTGVLEYSSVQKAWLLHYLPYAEDDRYGGCVTLVGTAPRIPFKPGQVVRVEGSLIDPNSMQSQPAYEVRSIRAAGS